MGALFSRRSPLLQRLLNLVGIVATIWTVVELLYVRTALVREGSVSPPALGNERIYIASIHWTNEDILRAHWNKAVVELAKAVGPSNVYVSVYESGSMDDTKGALRELDRDLGHEKIPRMIVLDDTTHQDEISKTPAETGWIKTPRGQMELRRIPYLARLRNIALKPLVKLGEKGMKFDKILFLNDVVFNNEDVRTLLGTRDGDYAAACSLDFKNGHSFYDTFALRDSQGHEQVSQSWPFFRSARSRRALKASKPVPMTSCWNGIVAMDAAPFYKRDSPLDFRGIPDSLAEYHLEGSECCLIHTDNPLSPSKGVWLNPNVRVGYTVPAYERVHASGASPWISSFSIAFGSWSNRVIRWTTTPWFKERTVRGRVQDWSRLSSSNVESGESICLINEQQVLVANGWKHV
ncbi:glycosyltransferase family 69 protein [Dothistroma septosporum NZE10]|uniref:Glycosyltransferase family 69 protein n=1 Tax=Dothistroma septosporum (strain NZE10 / CBS 128990) TaxID=675120 RepID=N1PW89_DOTSN|nr:glycosyltransferase family 69 protein [Dothistroma septosporum NZE10]